MTDMRVQTLVGIVDPEVPGNAFKPNLLNGDAVTKSDATVFSPPAAGLWVGGAGDIAVRFYGNQQVVTILAVPAGTFLPFAVDQVRSTNTTATSVLRFW